MMANNRETIKRHVATICLLLGLCLNSQAQMGRYSLKATLSQKDFADTITIEWDHGQVYVPVIVNNRQYRFLLDTGAAQTAVFADTPISGCTPAGQILSHDAIGTVDTVQMVTLPPMRLGTVCYTGCQATLQPRSVQVRRFDGILGFDLINRGLFAKIDVNNRQLILTDRKDFFNREQGIDLRYKLHYHVPYLQASPFGEYREEALFDTGSRNLYAINRSSFYQCAAKAGALIESQVEGRSIGRHAIGHFGAEPRSEVVFLNLSKLRMGDFTFTNVHTLTTLGDSHLGAKVLEYGAIIFMPRRKRMRFQPYNQQAQVQVANKQQDIAFVSENGMPCVGLVWEQGEPYKQGLREGDTILAIDGNPVVNFSHFIIWPFEIGREYRFLVSDRQGRQREIKWVRISKR